MCVYIYIYIYMFVPWRAARMKRLSRRRPWGNKNSMCSFIHVFLGLFVLCYLFVFACLSVFVLFVCSFIHVYKHKRRSGTSLGLGGQKLRPSRVRMCIYIYIYICVYMYVYIYIYIYTYICVVSIVLSSGSNPRNFRILTSRVGRAPRRLELLYV